MGAVPTITDIPRIEFAIEELEPPTGTPPKVEAVRIRFYLVK